MDNLWRPLGMETEEAIAEYDALHDGVPGWMETPLWLWIRESLTNYRKYSDGSGRVAMLNTALAESLAQTLRIPFPALRARKDVDYQIGVRQLKVALESLQGHPHPLQIVDYLLAYGNPRTKELSEILQRSNSLYEVGERSGRPGLVRRVALAIKQNADSVMARSGQSGVKLARSWELLYGIDSNPSEAYRFAIRATEDAAVPVVAPKSPRATLGTVIAQMENQKNWTLRVGREHPASPSGEIVLGMMRLLWHGQHDRHGGQAESEDVSFEEANIGVSLAITLVQWFTGGAIRRMP